MTLHIVCDLVFSSSTLYLITYRFIKLHPGSDRQSALPILEEHSHTEKTQPGLTLQARVTVVDWLKELGLFRGTEGNKMRLGKCSRSGDVIEPVIKPQWWVACKDLGAAAAQAVHDGDLTILPNPVHYLE